MTPELLVAAVGCTPERAATFADPLSAACAAYGIDTNRRLAAFLAQIGHESGSLRYLTELWGPTPAQEGYEGRADLGNTQPGDGEQFKGHGGIQITGRFNHARVRDRLRAKFPDLNVPDFEAEPERLAEPLWAMLSAADYWDEHGLNVLADADRFIAIGRAINRGNRNSTKPANGEADRIARWERAKKALPLAPIETRVPNLSTNVPNIASKEEPIMAPFIAAALPALIEAAPALIRIFGESPRAEKNAKAAEVVAEIAKKATGENTVEGAVAAIATDPQAAAAYREAVQTEWFSLAESGGGGVEGARKADAVFVASGVNALRSPAFLISLVLMAFPLMLAVDVFFVHPDNYIGELRTQIVTGMLLCISMVGAFWLGSSFGSARKDEMQAVR
jgi:putative chitinase